MSTIIRCDVITDAQLSQVVLGMEQMGYLPDPEIMHISISWVDYLCGENFSMFYSTKFKTFHLLANGTREKPGIYIVRTME